MGYLELAGWFVAAIGAALALGTGAALVTYRRSGSFPGQPPPDDERSAAPNLAAVAARIVLGVVLIAAGVAWTLAVPQG